MAARPKWTTALADWEARILRGESLLPCGPLFPDEAAASMAVFKSLRLVDIAGQPTIGEVARPWLLDWAEVIFGAYDAEAGERLINEFFLLVSKKNSKSTIAAAIMVTALVRNWRHYGELAIIAPTLEIANNSWAPAKGMIEADPELRELFWVRDNMRLIRHRTTGAELKILAADAKVVAGGKRSFLLFDELWLFGKMPRAADMIREAIGGQASRREGFVMALSTQSDDPPAGVFLEWLTRFRGIRDGEVEAPHALGLLYEFPRHMVEAGAYNDPSMFYVTNPNMGASVDQAWLRRQLDKARSEGPHSLAGFFAKHGNVEIGMALRADRWSGADHWPKGKREGLTLGGILARCDVVTIGIDGGGLDDLLGLAVIGRDRETGEWLHWGHAWASQHVLDRRKDIVTQLRRFEQDGDLTVVANMQDAFEDVAGRIVEIHAAGVLPDEDAVGVDPSGVALIIDAIVAAFAEAGVELALDDQGRPTLIVGVYQDRPLQGTVKAVEVKLDGRTFGHCGQPIMAWFVSNARVERRGNYLIVSKAAAGVAKIDGLAALFDAAWLMGRNPQPPSGQGSYLDEHPALVF